MICMSSRGPLVCAIADPTIVPFPHSCSRSCCCRTFCPNSRISYSGRQSHGLPAGIGQLPSANKIICTLPDSAPEGTTRSSASIDLWCHHLEGAIAVIGNAPTALFRLIEGLFEGWPPPAVILGFPVGFVGAADAKRFLYESNHGVSLYYLAWEPWWQPPGCCCCAHTGFIT